MKRSDRQNALVVSAIALCFMLTLGLSYFLAGEGFLLAFNQSEADEKCYLLCAGSYENAELARNAAELVRSRGGAGYVMTKERAEVVLAAYKSREDAEKVVESGSAGGGAYILEVPVGEVSVSWAEESFRDAAKSALDYFDIVFDCLYETANGVAEGALTLLDARTRVAVCRVRVEEMREDFLSRAREESGAEYVRCAPAIGRGGEISSALREWMRRKLKAFVLSVQKMVAKTSFDGEDDYRSHADAVWRALSHFRLLAAQRAGCAGVTALNEWAAEAVSSELGREGDWFPGFVLIVRTNDDTIGLFNGDVGVCLPDPENPAQTIVWFGDKGPTVKDCAFAPGLLPRFDAAYAMTIHQSQGSEFDEVAIILPEDADSGLATRELLYTGITRAKRGAVIFGRKEVFLRAASTPTLREGGLSDRLREFWSASDDEAQNA